MTTAQSFTQRIARLFAIYGATTLGGMLLFLTGYALWSGAVVLTEVRGGAGAALALVCAGAGTAAFALVLAMTTAVLLRGHVSLSFNLFGHALHLEFGERL